MKINPRTPQRPSAVLSALCDTNSGGDIAENAAFTRSFAEKSPKLLTLLLLFLIFGFSSAHANNILVSNSKVVFNNETSAFIEFNLSWDNSWRTDDLNGDGVTNWDAAWVFVKFRESGGDWQHAWLSTDDINHSTGTGTPATINIGTTNIGGTDRGMGAFIYRSVNGTGTFSITDARLLWDFAEQSFNNLNPIEIRVFAIEMVYVAEGAFAAGSGGSESSAFTLTTINTSTANTAPSGTGSLGGQAGGYPTGQTAPNAAWPNGYSAFYMMKYSITQQQYVDFLNTLTLSQANTRRTSGGNRYGITVSDVGVHSTTNPFVANNHMSWTDGAAYMDWSGLRPMTELEYEKAARGFAAPVADEYAWGTASIASQRYTLSNAGAANEGIGPSYSTTLGNANYVTTRPDAHQGPMRVGIFAAHGSNSGRVSSGASYWGIMELSGNLWERPVTVGHAIGRNFTGVHGDGALSTAGHANVTTWPGLFRNEVTGALGSGFRGGAWRASDVSLRVSDRRDAAAEFNGRDVNYGFRGVRTAPAAGGGG